MKLHFKSCFAKQPEQKETSQISLIQEDLEKTRRELEIAYSGFDSVTDPDLIDCYIYKVNAVLKRYKYLQEQASLLMPPENQ